LEPQRFSVHLSPGKEAEEALNHFHEFSNWSTSFISAVAKHSSSREQSHNTTAGLGFYSQTLPVLANYASPEVIPLIYNRTA